MNMVRSSLFRNGIGSYTQDKRHKLFETHPASLQGEFPLLMRTHK